MQLHRLRAATPVACKGAVVAIGNFDGVHRGHQQVLEVARAKAAALGLPLAVLTFSPHPRVFFQPSLAPHTVFPLAERLRLLAAHGVEHVYLQRFDAAFSSLSAEDFVQKVLLSQLQAAHVLTGENFVFGHKRSGHEALLRTLLDAAGVGYTAVPASMLEGAPISSTRMRDALHDGALSRVAELLGRPYTTRGRVLHGNRIGRLLGYPTANLRLTPRFAPRMGVYALWARLEGETHWRPAVGSYGTRPTFDGQGALLEVHLMRAPDVVDLYGQRMEVQWANFQRPEEKFATAEALSEQMDRDREQAWAWLEANPPA